MGSLIINDEELKNCYTEMEELASKVEEMNQVVNIILTSIVETTMVEGNLAENFSYLSAQASELQADYELLLKSAKQYIEKMIEDIDEADRDLYEEE